MLTAPLRSIVTTVGLLCGRRVVPTWFRKKCWSPATVTGRRRLVCLLGCRLVVRVSSNTTRNRNVRNRLRFRLVLAGGRRLVLTKLILCCFLLVLRNLMICGRCRTIGRGKLILLIVKNRVVGRMLRSSMTSCRVRVRVRIAVMCSRTNSSN